MIIILNTSTAPLTRVRPRGRSKLRHRASQPGRLRLRRARSETSTSNWRQGMSHPLSGDNRRARRYWSPARVARAGAAAFALLGASSALADEPARSEKPEEIIVKGKENRNVYNPDNLSLDRLKSVKKTQSVSVVPQILIE